MILNKFFDRDPSGGFANCRRCKQTCPISYADRMFIVHLQQKHSNDYTLFEERAAKLRGCMKLNLHQILQYLFRANLAFLSLRTGGW